MITKKQLAQRKDELEKRLSQVSKLLECVPEIQEYKQRSKEALTCPWKVWGQADTSKSFSPPICSVGKSEHQCDYVVTGKCPYGYEPIKRMEQDKDSSSWSGFSEIIRMERKKECLLIKLPKKYEPTPPFDDPLLMESDWGNIRSGRWTWFCTKRNKQKGMYDCEFTYWGFMPDYVSDNDNTKTDTCVQFGIKIKKSLPFMWEVLAKELYEKLNDNSAFYFTPPDEIIDRTIA